ncbi:sulfite exporter TauE/SafE family protein [Sphingomonas sp. LR60]|uniref:sulfite exporter TauE/SafE family protein n=1 Tax=Sphingomonas sp. LR60 TaxID=3050233 RepID=UPI002FE4055E
MIVTIVFVAAVLAFIVSSVAGGGAGLVLVPLLRLILPIASIPGALSIGTAASSMSRIWLFRTRIRWDVVRRFVPTALPAAALGAWLLTRFDAVYVEFLLGCFLLLNLPALFRRMPAPKTEQPLPLHHLPALGAAAGLYRSGGGRFQPRLLPDGTDQGRDRRDPCDQRGAASPPQNRALRHVRAIAAIGIDRGCADRDGRGTGLAGLPQGPVVDA